MDSKDKDLEILKILENDARVPSSEIATMLGMKVAKVENRIKALCKAGIIRKFKSSIDWKLAKAHRATAIVQVKVVPQQRTGFSKICREIAKDSRVKDLFVATGEYDLIILVEAKDIDEISEFVTEKLAPKKEVTGTYTMIVLEEFKRDGAISFKDNGERLKVSM